MHDSTKILEITRKIVVPIHSHNGYLRKLECSKLEAKFSENYVAPAAPEMHSINHKRAIWNIDLANGKSCRMRNDFCDIDDELYVIHVDADKFYYYWLMSSIILADQHRSNHCVLRKDMPNDYKFKDAVKGFSNCEESPVPLAFVSANFDKEKPYIGFINGVTRTMWLLANGAKSFPIEVHKEHAAQALHSFAGIGEKPMTYQDLKDKFDVKKPDYLLLDFDYNLA